MRIGEIELTPLSDGECRLPPSFYTGVDVAAHGLVAADGAVHIPIGCFLIRSGDTTVLVDAGMGEFTTSWATGGDLPGELARAGCAPEEIDLVLCTHLHIDHIGWLVHRAAPFFPNATVRFGADDWEQFVTGPDAAETRTQSTMQLLDAAGRLEPIATGEVALAPGLTAVPTPGHTPGHFGLVLASGTDRAVLLGDAVECPLQLEEPELSVLSDVDPALAGRTREALWRELEGTGTLIGAAHFPGLAFGRVIPGQGRRYFTPV